MASKFFQHLRVVPLTPERPRHEARSRGVVDPKALAMCSVPEARQCLSREQAMKLQLLPLGYLEILGDRTLAVAVAHGRGSEAAAALKFLAGIAIRPAEVAAEIVEEAIFIAYSGDDTQLVEGRALLQKVEDRSKNVRNEIAFTPPTGEVGRFLAALIEYGFSKRASDIHLVPKERGSFVSIRVHGELLRNDDPICSTSLHTQIASRVKVLAGLDSSQRHLPLDGAFSVPLARRTAQVRVSTVPTVHGEKVVLRLLGGEGAQELEDLGYSPEILDLLRESAGRTHGAIIVAGPTGSGKSSTLYALAHRAAALSRAVSSVEDPVEQVLPSVAQSQINEARGLTFPICIRSIVRQDPDVIMVGEMRDRESVEIAVQAALTGHLLLTSVHAGSVPGIIQRLCSLGTTEALIAETAVLLINQRLVPTLCEKCKVINLEASCSLGQKVCKPVGCSCCDYSGFAGRVPVAQVFAPSPRARELLRTGQLSVAMADPQARDLGWLDWRAQLNRLLGEGRISVESAEAILK